MKAIRKILVGLDVENQGESLTPGSRAAWVQALRLGTKLGARVDGLHSIYDDAEQRGSFVVGGAHGAQDEARVLHRGSGVAGEPWVLAEKRPFEALIQTVVEGDYDLLMVAKRTHLSRGERRLGTVSRKVLRKCPGLVWVVHLEHAVDPANVLAATDLSEVGGEVVARGAQMAELFGGRLSVAHAWQVPMDLQLSAARIGHEESEERRRAIAQAARERIQALPAVADLRVPPELFLGCDSPSHFVRSVAEKLQPDLVVLGTISRGGLPGVLVGNTAEKLLDRLDTSLLTVKPDDFRCPLGPFRSLAAGT